MGGMAGCEMGAQGEEAKPTNCWGAVEEGVGDGRGRGPRKQGGDEARREGVDGWGVGENSPR